MGDIYIYIYIYGFWDRIKLMGMVLISHHCPICLNVFPMHVVGGVEYVQKAHGPKARGYKSKKGEIWIQPRVYSYKRSKWGTEKR